jgi:hypothetical protein
MGSFVFSTRSAGRALRSWQRADGQLDGVAAGSRSSQLCRVGEPCLSKMTNRGCTYGAVGFDLQTAGVDEVPGLAKFNAWSSSISQGRFATVRLEHRPSNVIQINSAEWALTRRWASWS